MSKIGDFEQRLISDGMTDRDLEEYAKLLVRVRDKRQHCYTTAVKFPPERIEQAVKLIKLGLESIRGRRVVLKLCVISEHGSDI